MIQKIQKFLGVGYTEMILWAVSVTVILTAFFVFDGESYLSMIASLIGITSLVLAAKGNPISQVLIIVFSALYGFLSFQLHYYGEMLTYVGMTAPMAIVALISWLRHPYAGNKREVEVNHLRVREIPIAALITLAVTAVFYPILSFFNTANLIPSTLSVATSFLAVYLTFRRSPYFALAYAANDIVLIVLWSMMCATSSSAISMVACFSAFLVNDIYGFISWCRMQKRQRVK